MITRTALTAGLALMLAGHALPLAETASRGDKAARSDVNLPMVDPATRLATILARFDRAQEEIRTLQADFTEHKELSLLKEPVDATGRFYYASPDQAKWEYHAPDARVFLISDNTLMQYFPADKILERKDLRAANTNRLFKVFGFGKSSDDLRDFYDIKLGNEAQQDKGTYLLVLTPRRRALEKRISRVLLWVGEDDFLPRAMKYEESGGDFTHLTFRNLELNHELAANTFHLEIPEGVEVRDELKLFSSAKGSAN